MTLRVNLLLAVEFKTSSFYLNRLNSLFKKIHSGV